MTSPFEITFECVAENWKKIASMSDPKEAAALSKHFSIAQPALTEFIFHYTEDLSESAIELAYYVSLVIWQSYVQSSPKPILEIKKAQIDASYEAIDRQLMALKGTDESIIEKRILHPDDYAQPAILDYIVAAIYENLDEEIVLTSDEQGQLFIGLRAIADAFQARVTTIFGNR